MNENNELNIIGYIHRVSDFCEDLSYIPVVAGYLTNKHVMVELEDAKRRGLRCENCKFYVHSDDSDGDCESHCCCYAHEMMTTTKETRKLAFREDDFQFHDDVETHKNDKRGICEFYRFKFWLSIKRYLKCDGHGFLYDDVGSDLFFEKLPQAYVDEGVYSAKTITELDEKLIQTEKKIDEIEKFIDFFKSEIPDTYKLLKARFKKRDDNIE